MPGTCVANIDLFDLHVMAAVGRTRVDRVTVVNATANRITFDDFNTHLDWDSSFSQVLLSKFLNWRTCDLRVKEQQLILRRQRSE